MLYLSQVLGRPIRDLEGERVATVKDVIVRLGQDEHPPVTGFVARYRRRDFFLNGKTREQDSAGSDHWDCLCRSGRRRGPPS